MRICFVLGLRGRTGRTLAIGARLASGEGTEGTTRWTVYASCYSA